MLEAHRQICFEASKILFATPCDHPYRGIRIKFADQIELQALVGNPEHNDFVVDLSKKIIRYEAEKTDKPKVYSKQEVEAMLCPSCSGRLTVIDLISVSCYCDTCDAEGSGSSPHLAYMSLFNKMW